MTDGTEAGTHMVADISPGAAGSELYYLAGFDGEVFFAATIADHGHELWKSDGTAAGTVLAKDINPGAAGSNPGQSSGFTVLGDALLFGAEDGTTAPSCGRPQRA